jgi:hypothetical protein
VVHVSATDPGSGGPGVLTVVLGTHDEVVEALSRDVPSGIAFPASTAGATMVVSGQDWPQIEATVASLLAPLEPGPNQERVLVATAAWRTPEVPVMSGEGRLTLAALGLPTTEFTGRRFRTSFDVALPNDLYAEAYGHATLYLDAAYSKDVLPGSHVDVFVNGEIAATTPIADRGGGIFRHREIEVPLRAFQPGVNEVAIEAVVPTSADLACLPGSTASGDSRFVLFDTSEFGMPDFGRAAQFPDLSALAGTGYPLAGTSGAVSLILGSADADTYSAAATFIARIALLAGRPFDVGPVSGAGNASRFGLYVGAISQLPRSIAAEVGIASAAVEGWQDELSAVAGTPPPAVAASTADTFARWRDALSGGGGLQGEITAIQDWLGRTFDFSFASLRFGSAAPGSYSPPDNAGLMVAQGGIPGGQTSWTVVTAPSPAALATNTEALVRPDIWHQISGQVTVYRPLTGEVETVPLAGADLVVSAPVTPQNLRLVATNWLSRNLLLYGGLLLGLCILLGISTSWLLNSVGRHE